MSRGRRPVGEVIFVDGRLQPRVSATGRSTDDRLSGRRRAAADGSRVDSVTIPAELAQEVCTEADRVLAEIRDEISQDRYRGEYWAVYVYRVATERVQARHRT